MKVSLFRKKCSSWKYFYRRLSGAGVGAGAEKSVIVSAPAKKGGSCSASATLVTSFFIILINGKKLKILFLHIAQKYHLLLAFINIFLLRRRFIVTTFYVLFLCCIV